MQITYERSDVCIAVNRRYITGKFFGTDGFRGEAGVTITAEHAFKVGRVLGWYFGERKNGKCRAVIGKDTRLSSYTLEYALAAGLTSAGGDAYIMHVTTTPSVSYITRCDGFDCGIMISASHNPYYDNGIKLMNERGEKADESLIKIIESYLSGDLSPFGGKDIPFACGRNIGRTVDYVSGRNRYIGHLISLSTCSYKGLRVGIDGANGSAWQIARSVFDALGAKTYVLGASPDGINVNGGVGSTHIEALCALVKENGLDIGFAFDGDADRCIAVDENGEVLTGDEELFIAANYLKDRGELAGDGVVCTVLSNGGLIDSLLKRGIVSHICGVGDKAVCDAMSNTGVVLGGERSGHIVFSKYETTGDGLVTAVMLMEAVVEGKCAPSSLLKGYKAKPQYSVNVPVKNGKERESELQSVAVNLENRLGVRMIVRASGTEPVIRIMAESDSEENCVLACNILYSEICGKNCS